ncbi:MAG: ribonuclease H-like domain-containing protein, partial [Wujia sp.]
MQVITNDIHDNELNQLNTFYNPKDIVLFDIETTGFAAETTSLYLIGCGHYTDGRWQITQWFNDDGNSEKEIIESFLRFIKGYKYLLNYNGDGFDIPYIDKKRSMLDIPIPFDELESLDLYKQIRGFKDILHLDNLKQKTIEKFIGINRLDKYSGGDLIKVYLDYLNTDNETKKKLLLQHNYEDLEGLIYCFSLMSYVKLKAGCVRVSKMAVAGRKLYFSLELDYSLPKRITTTIGNIIITGYKKEAAINV